ncbi:hypothetical protein ACI0X3_003628 [Cronobacter turicensis]
MKINQAAIERLLRINWLENVGKDLDIPGTVRIDNIIDFENSLQSEEWENTSLEARNDITGFLAKKTQTHSLNGTNSLILPLKS